MNTPPSINRRASGFRSVQVAITLIPLAMLITGFCIFFSRYFGGDRQPITTVLVPVFGVLVMLGIAALVTLAILQRAHFVLAVLFFGGLAGLAFVNIASEALLGRDYGSAARAAGQYGLMSACLLLALGGLCLEIIVQRRAAAAAV